MKDETYHLDTNVFGDYSRGRSLAVKSRFEAVLRTSLAVSVIVVGELKVGAEKTGDPTIIEDVRARLEGIRVVSIDETVAHEYARIRAYLEAMGQKMDGNDLWIAATVLVHDATLVTADEAFERVPDLRTENWRV